ncbi:MAG: cofactor-independent phosphoglycerate mutase [Hadesarchaea archaeon]|nr:MAG: cofactor-independent phosphoglycerate mutase [Hadesarchaea archaeon]HDI12743.1 cofactor-independent phosphoglycerate mutase [Hadesarchaea archaeon]
MGDYPLEELGGKTPLQVARKPNLDWIAANGRNGLLRTIPEGTNPGSDIAIMSILGYDPKKYRLGRGPLEAAGMGIKLKKGEFAFRCNFITQKKGVIADYSAGHITTEEAQELINELKNEFKSLGDFYPGISYRHLFVLKKVPDDADNIKTTPPHDVVGGKVSDYLVRPEGNKTAKILNEMMLRSEQILSEHPVNISRLKTGKNPANMIWLWGEGKKPVMKTLGEKYGISGAVVSAVTVVKGIGVCAGMTKLEVPGATGYYDTNYENKAKYALRALEDHDLVLIHIEAPDEAGHVGDIERKIEAIENIDSRLLGNIIDALEGEYKIAVMADHLTPIKVRGHVSDPVPISIYSTGGRKDEVKCFDENSVVEGSLGVLEGNRFMDIFIRDEQGGNI